MKQHRTLAAGFTLVELMIVVAIVAILAGIAYPSYMEYVRSSRRAEGQQALLRIQLEQEKWRANNNSYTASFTDLRLPNTSSEGNYTLSLANATATGFSATATPSGFSDPTCGALTLTLNAGVETRGSSTNAATCWKK